MARRAQRSRGCAGSRPARLVLRDTAVQAGGRAPPPSPAGRSGGFPAACLLARFPRAASAKAECAPASRRRPAPAGRLALARCALRSRGCAGSRPAPGCGPRAALIRPPGGRRAASPSRLARPSSARPRALVGLRPGPCCRGCAAAWRPLGLSAAGRARRRGCGLAPRRLRPPRPPGLLGLPPRGLAPWSGCRLCRAVGPPRPCPLRCALRGSRAFLRAGGPLRGRIAAAFLTPSAPRRLLTPPFRAAGPEKIAGCVLVRVVSNLVGSRQFFRA